MAIIIDERSLSARQQYIRTILSPINKQIAVGTKINVDSLKLYAKDPSSGNDENALFKTSNEHLKGNYFEIWKKKSSKNWELNKLFFRIEVKKEINDYSEILAFHIDLLDNSENYYKKFPHIHLKHPTYTSISKAHIAFNLDNFSDITDNLNKFNQNINSIMKMIKAEFINEFNIFKM